MNNRLLPVGSSALEVAAAAACAELATMPVPLRELWDPATCPLNLLPYLAWAFSVDHWDEDWTEEAKRNVVSSAFFVHRHKGTIGAIRRVVENLGYTLSIKEWWQLLTIPGSFQLAIETYDLELTSENLDEIELLINETKPVSRKLLGLTFQRTVSGPIYVGARSYDGEQVTVLPYNSDPILVSGNTYPTGAITIIERKRVTS
ncbi:MULTISPECIES: phage tail protein I [Enterobacterales]|jgi:phage tail P2-like protein|uniref:Tail protein n=1 Tax=Serratia plymuthica S13 TaxID=1348660 RepID=S4YFI3_SERPL|nr:phage tail protein I [Serratia plymuthica]AGP43081.1 tail protein [Serratia plymuthica S13]ANJ92760.1 tail protein [Serratia plymuthica]ANJ97174.1 tail protein [Serratia plymuthica]EKF66207.1 phage tail protein I [Serratia plymuthica A30]KYG17691.1 Phage tail protein [Serratia plymuthica]